MFSEVIDKISSFADHHQAIFAAVVGVSIITVSWGVEKMLETHLFPNKPMYGYITAILSGLLLLWFTQHFILHVI